MIRRFLLVAALLIPGNLFAQSFEIESVEFSDSAYLSDVELQAIAAPFIDRQIGLTDLQQMVSEVQELYGRSGIVTARALLPPQEIRDGVLRVELVEATVARIEPVGFERTDPVFFRRTFSLENGQLPDFEALERDLRSYDISYDLRPTLSFRPGEEPGTTVAVIRAQEPDRYSITGSLDNFGSEETGRYRASIFARVSSLTGWRDTVTAQLQISEGASSGSVGYARPLGGGGGLALASLSYSNSSVISGPFAAIDIVSDSAVASVGYRRPFRVRPNSYAWGQVDVVGEMSESELESAPLSDQTLTEIVASAGWVLQGDKQNLSLSFGLKVGQAESDATSETEGGYQLAFANFGYARPFGPVVFDVSAVLQYAQDQNLPVARLFTLGGATTVRGYPSSARSGDSGLLARLQLTKAKPFKPESQPAISISPFGFLDFGAAVPFRDSATDTGGFDADQDILFSIGGGSRFNWNTRTRGLITVGVPLKDTLGFEASGATFYAGVDVDF